MAQKIYTNYWVDDYNGVRKEHGSYKSEGEALEGIKAWWEIHGESYPDAEVYRTNTGALEIKYGEDFYFYRIESQESDEKLPQTSYTLKTKGEIEAKRQQLGLTSEEFLFDELAEPYRDRLIAAFASIQAVRNYIFQANGRPIKQIS